MDWQTLLTRERLGKPVHSNDELGRSAFHKDHDRIIFSGAFRRLGRKTQVHPVSSNDHIHTRLTHSLEVACVGRSLGMRVGEILREELPEWCDPSDLGVIVQSACLAHDIGNPPFGHSGEDAIRNWFQQAAGRGWLDEMSDAERSDFLHFEGNAQGFRVLTQLEYHQFDGGTRLTYATLGTYLKYPWTSRHAEALGYKKHKFGCYQSELPLLEQITHKLGMPQLDDERWARHPLVYLMEAADDICYGLIDLEDGLEMELLEYSEVEALLLGLVGDDLPDTYRQLGPRDSRRRKLAILRDKAIEHLTNAAARAFVDQQQASARRAACRRPGGTHARPGQALRATGQGHRAGKDLPGQAQDPPRDRRLHHSGDPPQRLLWRRAGAIRRAYAVVQEPAHPRPARTQRARPAVAAVPRLSPGDRFHRRHDRQLRHGNGPEMTGRSSPS
ncbi:deoxyguanosinetriphosphate triphosphohydrolase [Pseudomonas aeruginosa]|nr:deoxyguanosinetriphosphate triphosphohydrolase [Pseudomonas aeruginosa]